MSINFFIDKTFKARYEYKTHAKMTWTSKKKPLGRRCFNMKKNKLNSLFLRERFVKSLFLLLFIFPLLLTPACKKMDHSKFKMPKMAFITAENLHDTVARGENEVWIIGDFGSVYYSCNNGVNWEKQNTGTEKHFFNASFLDNQNAWICGLQGIILHTSNGGKAWEEQKSNTPRHLFSICFTDEKNGWAVGDMGTIIATKDGGATWTPMKKEQDVGYNGVFFTDSLHGWVIGEFGTILYTSDGGKTWKPQLCKDIAPPEDEEATMIMPMPTLYSINFKDKKRGFIAGIEGILLVTEDGGMKWKKIPTHTKFSIFRTTFQGEKGWAVGAEGNYLVTSDGGKTWQYVEETIKMKFWLQGVSFRNDKDGFAVGARGTVVHTEDGGNTWKFLSGISYEMPEFKMPEF